METNTLVAVPPTAAAGRDAPSGPIVAALLLVMLLSALDQTIVSTALPTIVGELGGLDRLSWVVTAYLLSSTVVLPLYGKLGDLYGRKVVLQAAIALFLAGSALCGIAQDMPQLIVLRALQGLGGGGLMVVTMAAIGDLVPPDRRARYQGMFGGVYGLATIVGPLLGGFLVEHLSWRWIFTINLPLGALALAVIGVAFRPQAAPVKHRIDYMGAAFLATALTCVILFTSEGGSLLPWSSPQLWLTLVLGAVAIGGFVYEERLAAEPIMPLELFRQRTFVLMSLIGFVVGIALFGSVTFIPLYLQVVKGSTPSQAGLQLLPMMGGMLTMSVASGRLIARFGTYRPFPIAGTLLGGVAMALLSTLSLDTSLHTIYAYMALLGIGLGMVMPVLTLAVQNTVEFRHMGVATSGATLFRSIGGSLGVAAFGALFSHGLQSRLEQALPADVTLPAALGPTAVQQLPAAVRDAYLHAFAGSLHGVYLAATGVIAIAFVLAWFVERAPLRTRR
ncbi:MDR family MFS transporter [Burkholderia vietnamiensis]|uniref:MDR family MFS transporter n=1 Tax=Burkholderia vietnamiensis TaxID=60552 RepID=UPI000758BA2D|nr:MDR family MFS transporter [Burkholderia vietnamiensis]KVE53276.1 disulfide bond formation protein DsbA [Burkholderia vietnamiensis]KVE70031.1 disulfide bond formation protein DsbA [Burkholderia vietnamiensis]KVE87455.1 disulfide bond formation protein DsbA [Burkholderia vietnamiensis]KVF26365.1 disulfide bond formation protein DsbA [Burkholderia vietnamiensis]MDN7924327.1 MDR family MFS transporter [Burkholderia vietnamiensis]